MKVGPARLVLVGAVVKTFYGGFDMGRLLRQEEVIKVGSKYGKWTVTTEAFRKTIARGVVKWVCGVQCECGTKAKRQVASIVSGASKGCLSCRPANAATHHMVGERLYRIWSNMKTRCTNTSIECHKNYGGRGIAVCDEWQSFERFRDWAIANGYSDKLTLDRKKNAEGYNPDNCRWATRKEQSNNTRRNRLVSAFGEVKTLDEWTHDSRVSACYGTISTRLRDGWNEEEAVATPARKGNYHGPKKMDIK